MEHRWTCHCCGRTFSELPTTYSVPAPDNWLCLEEAGTTSIGRLEGDICTIGDSERYVRGAVEIPISGWHEPLVLNVWVSVSEASLAYIRANRGQPVPEADPPRFGWLCTTLPGYPEPHEIKCHVYLGPNGQGLRIELEPTDYPLAVEQRSGVTLDRVKEFAASSTHGSESP